MRKKQWALPELNACPYYVQSPQAQKGKWNSWFPKKQPIHLELGCGKGVFLAEIARRNPQINYVGIDISSDVLGVARRNIEAAYQEENRPVENIALVMQDIEKILTMMDEHDVVERIYINFCNPWPRGKHRKKRLTHNRQLERYRIFLKDDGELHFKTDDDDLYISTLRYLSEENFEILWQTKDLHAENRPENILTEHEERFSEQGIPIKAIVARYHRTSEG